MSNDINHNPANDPRFPIRPLTSDMIEDTEGHIRVPHVEEAEGSERHVRVPNVEDTEGHIRVPQIEEAEGSERHLRVPNVEDAEDTEGHRRMP